MSEVSTTTPTTWTPRQNLEPREWYLYVGTLLLELPGAGIRFLGGLFLAPFLLFPVWFFFWLVVFLNIGNANNVFSQQETLASAWRFFFWSNAILAFGLSFGNIILSLLTLNGVYIKNLTGNFLTRFSIGARLASRREREKVREAFSQITANISENSAAQIERFNAPADWYVVDDPSSNAFVVGTTLYITRELINSPALASVLSHELGHLNSIDGRLILALRRLVMPYMYLLNQTTGEKRAPGAVTIIMGEDSSQKMFLYGLMIYFFGLMLTVAGGGLGLFLLNPAWVWHWRDREYFADNFAARCGFAGQLIKYLEKFQYFDTATPWFMSTHPYTELRIDRLLAYEEQQSEFVAV